MKDVIIALDFRNREEVLTFLDRFKEPVYVKVGMELYYAEGPSIVREIKALGHKVFLDLKFHDIPNTVQGAVRSAAGLDADMLNLHAMGGEEMMRGAMKELEGREKKPLLIAVTVLTSMDEETLSKELHVSLPLEEEVLSLARLTKKSGLQGVVCSALEVPKLKKALGEDFLTITPGIRPKESASGDQKRVVTPAMARELGSDYIVVGRPITKAENPYAAYLTIRAEFMGGERI
ncbi:orotidine-5'-phosphate decarboxylase [Proteiniclasticum sp. C24MP]|uniref:orotidine-5'-phosphate decarboxylase n=1 Tax=Proteiniclasticum sp. C24MP TaxID=3374101 RepID=UPI0037549B64